MCKSSGIKNTPWTIYDEVGCIDGDYIAEEVEGIVMNIDKFLPNIIY